MKAINLNEVMANSPAEDWALDSKSGLIVHKTIEKLVIEKITKSVKNKKNFFWEDHCQIKINNRTEFMIQYDRMYIARYSFIEIDDRNINLPLPRLGTNEVSSEQLNLADIVNNGVKIDNYIEKAQLTINNTPLI